METDDQAPWEPIAFAVGQRVRVLARPECEYCAGDPTDAEAGETGTVDMIGCSVDDTPDTKSHRFWVELDNGRPSHFAAVELEPLD